MTLLEKHPERKPIYDAIEDGADIKGALDEIMEGCKKGGPDYHFVYCPECNTEGCRAYATDKGDGEECLGPLVTMAMAKAEKWYTKNGSKWLTMPELMLRYRAAAFWVRTFTPELSLGMHTVEEVRDMHEKSEQAVIVAREGETSLDAFARTMEEQEDETTEREPGSDEHLDADFEDENGDN